MADTVMVATIQGELLGVVHDGISRFAGIPFAAAPTGRSRFGPPAPPVPWGEARDATHFGAVSPQNPSLMDALFGGEPERWDEDCLHLNIWSSRAGERDAHLPVMVWIHGGGFEMGSGSSPIYDGTSFAARDVVFVSINYRLGSLGFLELGHLDPELAGSGNAGLLDQVAALTWVRDNIGAFGGDPSNVTIFGESAGAMSASLLMTMPSASGLFHRVILQSGSLVAAREPARSRADTDEFMAAGGFSTVEELRAAPVADLLAAHGAMSKARMADPEDVIGRYDNPLAFLPFRPVLDGATIPSDPLGAITSGAAAGVELVIGTNLEEWKLFALMAPGATTREDLASRVELLGADPGAVLPAYEREHPAASVADLECALLTDVVFRIPACNLADAQSAHAAVRQYRFDWRSPAMGGLLGAAHAVEIPFVFDMVGDHRLHVMVGAEAPLELATAMQQAWVSFASGDDPAPFGLQWPSMDEPGRPVLCWDTATAVHEDPFGLTRRLWTDGV